MRVTHLIPTYNESENIRRLLPKLQKFYLRHRRHKFCTLIIDDSTDDTCKLIKQFQKKDPSIISKLGPRQGLGTAMVYGYRYAMRHLKPDIIITNEADFAYNHEKISLMLQKIAVGYDVVVASRHCPGGTTNGWTWSRHLNHWIANTFFATWIAGNSYVSDHNGAFRAIRVKTVLDKIVWFGFPKGFAFLNYLLYVISTKTNRFYEFPTTYHFRTRGESKISFNQKYLLSYLYNIYEYITFCLYIRFKNCQNLLNPPPNSPKPPPYLHLHRRNPPLSRPRSAV